MSRHIIVCGCLSIIATKSITHFFEKVGNDDDVWAYDTRPKTTLWTNEIQKPAVEQGSIKQLSQKRI